MQGKITKSGALVIKRGDSFKKQVCQFRGNVKPSGFLNIFSSFERHCCDECPLFGEPEEISTRRGRPRTLLPLCSNQLLFDDFTDERVNPVIRLLSPPQPSPSVAKAGLTWLRVCVPREWTNDQIESWANANVATGISSLWQVRTRGEGSERVNCNDHGPDFVHVMLDC